MEERFHQELEILKLKEKINLTKLVLAVSGGVDSVVLAHLLKQENCPYTIAHCNFKLRGDESENDEQFVRDLAANLDCQIFVKSFATDEYAAAKGISIQMAARELRYAWFAGLIKEGGYIVTAHHANDVAETMLFNLIKGTGIAGLHGIRRFDGSNLRPLLWASKADIHQFAKKANLSWREDSSNDDNKYNRNIIRNVIIPEIERVNPLFIKAAVRTANRISDSEELLDYTIAEMDLVKETSGHTYIDKEKLSKVPGQATVLYRLISKFGFNYDQVNDILASLSSTGAVFVAADYILNIDREALIVSSNKEVNVYVEISASEGIVKLARNTLQIQLLNADNYEITDAPAVAGLDFDKLSFPLIIRSYKMGDRFQPLGMTGKKLISDFLIDQKVPQNLKMEQLVLESGGDIAWLLGQRIDDRFKISTNTRKVFEIRIV